MMQQSMRSDPDTKTISAYNSRKFLFISRKMKVSDENPQDFLAEIPRLALEAYPDIQTRAAAGERPAVNAKNRAQERTHRVREAFVNGMPIKTKRFLKPNPKTWQARNSVPKSPVDSSWIASILRTTTLL